MNVLSGQSDIKKLRRENYQLRKEIWSLRDEYDRLGKLIRNKGCDGYGDSEFDENDDDEEEYENDYDDDERCCSCHSNEVTQYSALTHASTNHNPNLHILGQSIL